MFPAPLGLQQWIPYTIECNALWFSMRLIGQFGFPFFIPRTSNLKIYFCPFLIVANSFVKHIRQTLAVMNHLLYQTPTE